MPTDLRNLSIAELKTIKRDNQQKLKKDYSQYKKKQKLIDDIKKIEKVREKKSTTNQNPNTLRSKHLRSIFRSVSKIKQFPLILERAIKEHNQGIVKEKLALEEFANKYIVKGESGFTPFEFFRSKSFYLKDFLRNHRNIKVRFVLVCLMEKMSGSNKLSITFQDKAYFQSDTYINLESTDVKGILAGVIRSILEKISIYQQNGSGFYFKELLHLEIHTVEYKPMRGSSYIPLPDWIMRKKAIVNIRNTDEKCFLWCVLRYLHPRDENETRLTDLKQYETILNTKGINFSVKLKDIPKFETLNPSLPGINVFSVNENNKSYPLRMAQRSPQKTIDLFLYEEDGKYHYSLIKNFSRLFRSQITSRTNGQTYICKKCFTHFSKGQLFQKHIS